MRRCRANDVPIPQRNLFIVVFNCKVNKNYKKIKYIKQLIEKRYLGVKIGSIIWIYLSKLIPKGLSGCSQE